MSRSRIWAKEVFKYLVYLWSGARLTVAGCRLRGKRVYIARHVKIRHAETVMLDDDAYIGDHCHLLSEGGHASIKVGKRSVILRNSILTTNGGPIEIGADSSVNYFCILYGGGGLRIGNGVRIAAHSVLIPQNHSFDDLTIPIYKQPLRGKGIVIEDDVWIGAHCVVLDGVHIGKGSVIGAGSVVNQDIPGFSVAVGVPARIVKRRGGGGA